jgi:hypothetical protein
MILADAAVAVPELHPGEWADAIIRVGWPVPVLVALYIVVRWWPWRRTKE